jgi:serine/threonine protein kinase
MDKTRAKKMAKELVGKKIGGWTIRGYVNNGKSAVILRATRSKKEVALKIFDPDLVSRFGREAQLARVEREKDLIGKRHPNLIEIVDGGECQNTGYIFVAMAYLPGKNLSEILDILPRDRIFPLISQIASAAKFLDEMGLAHRDIKPDNIAISDSFDHSTLLDLGVLRPVGLSEITDENDQKVFVGTLRYSSPELLYREEADTPEGWRAVTFYQLGAVLHDMIMCHPIFPIYSEPYAKLVDAVRNVVPKIAADDVDSSLILLAKSCLVKDPKERVALVSWSHFLNPPSNKDSTATVRDRITKRRILRKTEAKENLETNQEASAYKRALNFDRVVSSIKEVARTICVRNKDCFPPFQRIYYVKPNDTRAKILVCFSPSENYDLKVALTFGLQIVLTGVTDEILELRFSAFASNKCPTAAENIELEGRQFFKGPFEANVIKKKIYHLFLTLIDRGQQLCVEDVSGKTVGSQQDTMELSLESES